MPYKIQPRTGKKNDRRIKITEEDRENIKKAYKKTNNVREVARMFEHLCSRRSIQFVLFPERLEHMQKHQVEIEHWKKYYDKEKRRVYMQNHRTHLKELLKDKKI